MTSIRTKKAEPTPVPVTAEKKNAKVDTKAPVKVADKKPEAQKKETKPVVAPKK